MTGLLAIEYVLPEKELTNEALEAYCDGWSAEKIYKKTGISSRHIAGPEETALDLAEKAANQLFSKGMAKKEEIDFLIMMTQSPDYILPGNACVLQHRLGLRKDIGAFDINLGCSAYIYGLTVAKAMVDAGIAKKVLLVTGDTYSKYLGEMDRSTRTIFGDGATVSLIGEGGFAIGQALFGTDGSGANLLCVPESGCRKGDCSGHENQTPGKLQMDGTGIFEFALREVPESVNQLLEKASVKEEEVDLYVFHQANRYMLDFLRKIMRIPQEKFYINLDVIGNTVSSSIPIALKQAWEEGRLKKGQRVVLVGFGVGLSWGAILLKG